MRAKKKKKKKKIEKKIKNKKQRKHFEIILELRNYAHTITRSSPLRMRVPYIICQTTVLRNDVRTCYTPPSAPTAPPPPRPHTHTRTPSIPSPANSLLGYIVSMLSVRYIFLVFAGDGVLYKHSLLAIYCFFSSSTASTTPSLSSPYWV